MSSMRSLQRQVKRAKEKRAERFEKYNDPPIPPEDQLKEMEAELEKLKEKQRLNLEKAKKKGTPIVWAKMIYICEDCGNRKEMFLENTLERHNGEKHKPVPFGIRCPYCGGFHCYDRSGLIPLPAERPLEEYESYFKDSKKYDCGKPVYR